MYNRQNMEKRDCASLLEKPTVGTCSKLSSGLSFGTLQPVQLKLPNRGSSDNRKPAG